MHFVIGRGHLVLFPKTSGDSKQWRLFEERLDAVPKSLFGEYVRSNCL
jgi:hypothetical protein